VESGGPSPEQLLAAKTGLASVALISQGEQRELPEADLLNTLDQWRPTLSQTGELMALGVLYGTEEQQRRICQYAVSLDEQDDVARRAFVWLAGDSFRNGKDDAALAYIDRLTSGYGLTDKLGESLFDIGAACAISQKWEALDALTSRASSAAREVQNSPWVKAIPALRGIGAGDASTAQSCITALLEEHGTANNLLAEVICSVGRAYEERGRLNLYDASRTDKAEFGVAVRIFERVVDEMSGVDRSRAMALRELVICTSQLDDHQKTIEYAEMLIAESPKDRFIPAANWFLARAYEALAQDGKVALSDADAGIRRACAGMLQSPQESWQISAKTTLVCWTQYVAKGGVR